MAVPKETGSPAVESVLATKLRLMIKKLDEDYALFMERQEAVGFLLFSLYFKLHCIFSVIFDARKEIPTGPTPAEDFSFISAQS